MLSLEERHFIDKCQDFGFLLSRAVQILAPSTVLLTKRRNFHTLYRLSTYKYRQFKNKLDGQRHPVESYLSHCISISI